MKKTIMMLVATTFFALQAPAGWVYESSVVVTGGRADQSAMMNSKTRSKVSGSRMRTEFIESGNPIIRPGNYMLSTDGGQTLKLVDPAEKTYSIMDLGAFAGIFSGGMMKITNPKFEKVSEEDGGKLLGYPVKRIKFNMSHTIEMNIFGMKNTSTSEATHEIWAAPGIREGGTGFWSGKQGFKTGDENLDQIMMAEMNKVEGLPLKHVMTSRTTDAAGQVDESVMTTTVTSVREEKVPEAAFEIPSDYSETPLVPMGQAGKDSGGATPGPGFDPAKIQEMMKQFKLPAK